ncbi:uncharacterized protein LOC111636448 [Centruroides sculpturatus]|uniref:uncharacterized protein LOC111636448 n=1 Tax=Centruroides sculpturatus TaxID=218467 RepID=UPI000C6CBE81|nr:uncharacterized protein LOC111636448 [Centruroides sculpturatus]
MTKIEEEIKTKIKSHELKIKVKSDRQVKGDGICFRTDTHEEAEVLSEAINKLPEISSKVKSKISEGRRPRLILSNVPKSVNETELTSIIIEQNENLPISNDEFIKSTRISTILNRNNAKENCRNIVLSTTPKIRNILVGTKHVAIVWAKIQVNDYIPLVRCFQCCGFNHISTDCTKNQKCSHCNKGHRFGECQRLEEPPCCTNCRTANKDLPEQEKYNTEHNAFNPQCPVTIRMKALTIRQTNYGV